MSILPNAYYNYRKKLAAKLEKVGKKFHDLDGTRGYRQVCDQLKKDGTFRYNCTIIDLFNICVIASETDKQLDTELAIKTVLKGI